MCEILNTLLENIVSRPRTILGDDNCDDEDETEEREIQSRYPGSSASEEAGEDEVSRGAHAKTVDYFDPTKAGGADDEAPSTDSHGVQSGQSELMCMDLRLNLLACYGQCELIGPC